MSIDDITKNACRSNFKFWWPLVLSTVTFAQQFPVQANWQQIKSLTCHFFDTYLFIWIHVLEVNINTTLTQMKHSL